MDKLPKATALLVLLLALPAIGPQSNGQKRQQTSKTPQAKKQPDRLQILQHELPKLAGSALNIKNLELRIETLGRLADLLWTVDAVNARALFQQTFDLLRSIEPVDDKSLTSSSDTTAKLPRGKLISLYVRFFSLLAKHDLTWKEQLVKQAPDFLNTPGLARSLDLSTANLLLQGKDHRAFEFINAGISGGVSGLADTMQILDLLRRFREVDTMKADQLFLQVMHQLENQSSPLADDLLTIGNYLFTGRPPGSGPEDKIIISPVYVGRIGFHADISYDRPGISAETVDGYLRSSVAIVTRPVNSEAIQVQNRAAAFLLLPKARRLAPDLVPILSNLATGIDPTRTNSVEARGSIPEPSDPATVDSVISEIETIKDPVKKDEYCLRMVWSYYLAADFKAAAALTDRMRSPEIREQLSSLISIGQAIDSFKKGDLESAHLQTRKLAQCKERSFLWFAIAGRMIEKGELQSGRMAIDSGLADARRTDGSVKASLLLLGSELMSGIDSATGANILSEALTIINAFDSDLSEPLRFDRFVRVRVGSQTAIFSTDVNGSKTGTVRGAFKVPVSRDPNSAITLILQLKNEHMRSSALLVLVSELTS